MKKICLVLLFCAYSFGVDIYQQKIGENEIFSICLSKQEADKSKLIATNEVQKKLIKDTKLPANCQNVILVKSPKFNALIDTGFNHTQNALKSALKELSLNFDDINAIILTHGHGDHLGGILNESSENNFKNAKLFIDKKEFDFWQKSKNEQAKKSLQAFEEIEFFNDDDEILSGIFAKNAYGHTPGHNIIIFKDKDKNALIFTADLFHFFDIQKQDLSIAVLWDNDKQMAINSRLNLAKMLQNTQLIGSHFPSAKPLILEK